MGAMNDASCPKCKKRFGWSGDLKDCPPCPRCGHQIPPEEWTSVKAEMDKFRDSLIERKKKRANDSGSSNVEYPDGSD